MKDVIKLVVVVVIIVVVLWSCVESEKQNREIEMKKIEWDMKIEQKRRLYEK